MKRAARAAALALALALAARAAGAQDFSLAAPPFASGAAAAIESGLPAADARARLECGAVRWLGLAALEGRSLAAGIGWRSLRAAAGIAAAGDEALGWNAAGAALGAGFGHGGAALRAVARRDRAAAAPGAPPAAGAEAGFGAWLETGSALRVWVSAPQAFTDGEPPPLARGLVLGACARAGDLALWLGRETVRVGPDPAPRAEHFAGIATRSGPLALWLDARERPLRGAVGVAARAGPLEIAASIESHPLAGETTRLALRAGGARSVP